MIKEEGGTLGLAVGIDDAHWADEGTLELLEEVAYGLYDTRSWSSPQAARS